MHNPIIYKKIGINIISPTTSVCDHSSFPKLPFIHKYILFFLSLLDVIRDRSNS